jgi:hypothetical protein
MRSELMAAIYDKALKRKDFSGIVNKDVKAEDAKDRWSTESRQRSRNVCRLIICASKYCVNPWLNIDIRQEQGKDASGQREGRQS